MSPRRQLAVNTVTGVGTVTAFGVLLALDLPVVAVIVYLIGLTLIIVFPPGGPPRPTYDESEIS